MNRGIQAREYVSCVSLGNILFNYGLGDILFNYGLGLNVPPLSVYSKMFTLCGFSTIVASFVGFSQLQNVLKTGWIPAPKKYKGIEQQHKWRNTTGSLVHAILMGFMSPLSLPYLWDDFVNKYTQLGEITLGIAIGYSVYDALDLIRSKPLQQIWPLLVHHSISVFFPSVFLWRQECLAYGILCLTVEINSVYLHVRQLLLMYEMSKTSLYYKINNTLNLITYIFLRIPAFLMMILFLFGDRGRMIGYWNTAMISGAFGLLIINLILFKRLIQNDFIRQSNVKNEVNGNIMDT